VGPTAEGVFPPEAVAILERVGDWYGRVKEALVDVAPAHELTSNRDALLTRRGNTLYVHLHKDPPTSAVKLNPIDIAPRAATLLNTGEPVSFAVDMLPSDHAGQKAFLRLRGLPVNELANTVPVVRVEFDELPCGGGAEAEQDEVLRM
jgi:alpha-L-fucosidase